MAGSASSPPPPPSRAGLFRRLIDRFGADVEIHTQICPGLVEAVEGGDIATPATRALLEAYLTPLLDAGIDQLVLGCTHYPFLQPLIEDIVGPGIAVIDPAPAVARQAGRVLALRGFTETDCAGDHPRTSPSLSPVPAPVLHPEHAFYTTGDPDRLRHAAHTLVGYIGPLLPLTWCDGCLGP